jgi:putative ABC transport system substrate-binding protein
MEPQLFTVREIREIAGAFATMRRTGADAVVVLADAVLAAANRQISVLATEHRLPAMYDSREYVEGGGLISYGPNIIEMVRRSTRLVDKILKGANPADLPIEQPAKFELVTSRPQRRSGSRSHPQSLRSPMR